MLPIDASCDTMIIQCVVDGCGRGAWLCAKVIDQML